MVAAPGVLEDQDGKPLRGKAPYSAKYLTNVGLGRRVTHRRSSSSQGHEGQVQVLMPVKV